MQAILVIPQGNLLSKLLIFSDTTQAVSVGTAPAGTQIIDAKNIVGGDYLIHTEDIYAATADKPLYITSTNPVTLKYKLSQ
jgi:hypothetical protein